MGRWNDNNRQTGRLYVPDLDTFVEAIRAEEEAAVSEQEALLGWIAASGPNSGLTGKDIAYWTSVAKSFSGASHVRKEILTGIRDYLRNNTVK